MKRLIFPLLMLLGFVDAKAGNGDWRIYAAYHDAQKVVSLHNRVYVLSDGGLYSYDPEDTSVDTYTKANTLSDHNIYDIEACESTGELVIIYTNGNIDLLNANGDAYSMPDLKLKSLSDKTLNNVLIDGTTLYVSTNSGVVLVNLRNHTFGNFYSFGHKINDIALDANNMYAATADGVYVGKLSDNLLDKNNWKSLSNLVALDFITFSGSIYATTKNALLKVTDNTSFSTSSIASAKPSSCYICNGNLFYLVNGSLYSIDASGSTQNYGSQSINHLSYSQSTYWAACGESGLIGYTLGGNSFTVKTASVIPNSPHRNFSYQMKMIDNKRLLMTGGAFNYPEVLRAGSVMKYEGNKWSYFDEAGPKEALGNNDWYINVTDVVQDRNDSSHHFVSAACSGLFEFKGGKLIKNYSYNNSPLTTIIPTSRRPGYYVRITGLAFDSQNNLWMCNNECDTIVRIRKADGSWTSFFIPEIASYPTFDHVVFDRRGWAWINSRRSTSAGHQAGVIIVNTNNNPGSPSGFSYKFIPIKNKTTNVQAGFVDQDELYRLMTEVYSWDALARDDYFVDYQNMYTNLGVMSVRNLFLNCANIFADAGQDDRALEMVEKCFEVTAPYPLETVPLGFSDNDQIVILMIEHYYQLGQPEKARQLATRLGSDLLDSARFYLEFFSLSHREFEAVRVYISNLAYVLKEGGDEELSDQLLDNFLTLVEAAKAALGES